MTDDNAPLNAPGRSPSDHRARRRQLLVITAAGLAGIALVVAGILGGPGGDQNTAGTLEVCIDGGCPTDDAASASASASASSEPSSAAPSPSSADTAPSTAASPTSEASSSASAEPEDSTPSGDTAQDSPSAASTEAAGASQSPPSADDGAATTPGEQTQPSEEPAAETSGEPEPAAAPATAADAEPSPSVSAFSATVVQRSAQGCDQTASPNLAVSTAARPGPCSTGVDTSMTLTAYPSGTLRTSTTIENARIDGDLIVEAPNVTLVNVLITGRLLARADNLVVEHSTIGHLGVSSVSNVRASHIEVAGYPGEDGIHVTSDRNRMVSNVLIENSWVHNPLIKDHSHYDGIQVRGVDGLTIRNVYFDLGPWKDDLISSIFVQNANGGNRNVTITSNWIDGGGYAMYLDGTGIVVTNNVFGSNARWGLLYPKSDRSRLSHWGNVWAHDGSPVTF